jgi:2-haloacid dehalogenase
MKPTIKGIVFDAYGTLFDIYSITQTAERFFPGKGEAIAVMWRDKQIEYTRVRTMCDRYKPFWDVTRDALVYVGARLKLDITNAQIDELMGQYWQLSPHPDAQPALQALAAKRLPMAVLSNGNSAMLQAAVRSAGFEKYFLHLLSVDQVQKFKTAPEAYQLGPNAFNCRAGELAFVSSNAWDIAGATWFGYHTFWVNRAGLPMEQLDVQPVGTGASLNDLNNWLGATSFT